MTNSSWLKAFPVAPFIRLRLAAVLVVATLLPACAWRVAAPTPPAADELAPTWHSVRLPGKAATRYTAERHSDGTAAWHAVANKAASAWRKDIHRPPQELGRVAFSWWTAQLPQGADVGEAGRTDAAVRLVFAFDGDAQKLSARQRMLMELASTLGGEMPPYATLVYTWDPQREVGSVVPHPRLDRIRKWILESGPANLGRWLHYERDLVADFRQAFGEEPGRLLWVGLMTDSDNTQSFVEAWYGPIRWENGAVLLPR